MEMSNNNKNSKKNDMFAKIMAGVLAGLMIFGVVAAAFAVFA